MSWLAAGAAIVGSGISAYGQIRQGQAAASAAPLQAASVMANLQGFLAQIQAAQAQSAAKVQAANFNIKVALENAQIAREQARGEATQINRENVLRIGQARAAAGASGVTAAGSVIDVLGDIVTQGELERQQAFYVGELQARGFLNEAFVESMSAQASANAGRMLSHQAGFAIDAARIERQMVLRAGQEALGASRLQAGATLLGGAAQASSNFSRLST